jgi:hypothetical protein
MRDDRKRYPYDAPIVETEGMGGAGGGDLDDLGDVGNPRERPASERTGGRGLVEGLGGAGGGDVDDLASLADPGELQGAGAFPSGTGDDIELARQMGGGSTDTTPDVPAGDLDVDDIRNTSNAGRPVVRGVTGTVTGITTGVDTDDASDGPGTPWDDLRDGLRDSAARGTDTPESQPG